MATATFCDMCLMPIVQGRSYFLRSQPRKGFEQSVQQQARRKVDMEVCPACADAVGRAINQLANTRRGLSK